LDPDVKPFGRRAAHEPLKVILLKCDMDLITTHVNADFDGLASMMAARKLYPGAVIVLSGGAQEAVRSFLEVHDLGITRQRDIVLNQVRRLIVCDAQEPERLGTLKELWGRAGVEVHLFDHHVDEEEPRRFEPEASSVTQQTVEAVGATTTLLVERLWKEHIPVTPFEATVLALGLYEETGSMAYVSTTPRDLEAAAAVLRAGADLTVVSDTLRRPLDPHLIALLNDLLRSSEVQYVEGRKVLLATSAYDRYRGDLAEAVHRLAELKDLDAVISAIAMEDKIQLIGRSRRPEIDVAWICRQFGGGGHAVAAAAAIKGKTLIEVREALEKLIKEHNRPIILAKDIMTRPVKTARADETVQQVERALTKYSVNVLPVLDGDGHYLGVVSREIVQKALFHRLQTQPIEDFLQRDHYTATPETPFRDIETQMIERNQRFVPILHQQTVIGVITRTDLLRTLHQDIVAESQARSKESSHGIEGLVPRTRHVGRLMQDRLPERLLVLLRQAGALADRLDMSVYVVGGFVRDLLLDRQNLDVDVVVEGDGLVFARALAKELKARVKAHERFGTAVVLLSDGFKLDVATARTEYYEYPTALPTVEQSSIKNDLYRRDFTINTLAVRLNGRRFGELIDFYGGQRDLKEGTIRVLHSLSLIEDPTRVFRAVRFEHRFGFSLGKETLALIKGAVKMELFHRLSGHRLIDELRLLLSERRPRGAVARLADLGLLRFIHPKLAWSAKLDRMLQGVEEAMDWYKLLFLDRKIEPWLPYLMAFMDVLPDRAVIEMLKRFPFSETESERIKAARFKIQAAVRLLTKRPAIRPSETVRALRHWTDEPLLYLMGTAKSETVKRQVSAFLTTYRQMSPTLTGADLKTMGLKPGPQYKRILSALLDARLNGEVATDAEERQLAARLAKQGRTI
jgi:tRNA nucleotidyltransferase (CCA-adding enzyme)